MEIVTNRVTVKNGACRILLNFDDDSAMITTTCDEFYLDDIHDLKTLAETINAAVKLIEERMLNSDPQE